MLFSIGIRESWHRQLSANSATVSIFKLLVSIQVPAARKDPKQMIDQNIL